MDNIRDLVARYWQTALLFFFGLILIVYIGFGFVYLQQAPSQRNFEEQLAKLTAILANPLPSREVLQAEYESVNRALTPMTDAEAIALLVSIAGESGIDVSREGGKLGVPSASFGKTTVDGATYQLISFRNIQAQGDYDKVMAFVSVLDSGSRLETMVLKRVVTSEVEVFATGEEEQRKQEFRDIQAAVASMMSDNALLRLSRPLSHAGGKATNMMGDDPRTADVEGFPDISTTAIEKGYTGNMTPKNGYVLHGHDRINTANTTQYDTVNYLPYLTTTYYYTAEEDGTVRQWSGADINKATEYLDSEHTRMELRVVLDVDIYTN